MKFPFLALVIAMSHFTLIAPAAEDHEKVFPKIKIEYPIILGMFIGYAKEQNLKPLQPGHLRFFIQPLGIIDSAFDVDLKSGGFVRYPGTHDKEGIQNGQLSEQSRAALIALLASKKFQGMPELESKPAGLDGKNFFVEVDWQQRYLWRLRWEPEDSSFKKIEKLLKDTVTTKAE